MCAVVYFSSVSENTHRFVAKLGMHSFRIPLRPADEALRMHEPYVLIVPTYGGGALRHAVPKQVIRFLNDPHNRELMRGVISSGNTNFGSAFCTAGPIISRKCGVPDLARFELLGTKADVDKIRQKIRLNLEGVSQ
ncbi:Putative NrdI-like protein [Corynebacterium capitovis DSM 44611]|uniref:class Ib ribonucleoside-diphosphate reductase assembly flavoprotein NrdI n=1 Tax=Corynebacterium capitovis TaxID=131081 RepID=UPI000361C6AB|nr:class Ib ribonucleoside-diphosphate reductase assembly flavoprotein NrdI [Corynebacterium capitovis]WKD58405.1 Putative NrdI-like protein [Corynebacterium capitovis DSM 44611]